MTRNVTTKFIKDFKTGDIVHCHNGKFRIVADAYDSTSHGPTDPATGFPMGPSGVAVAKSICIEGETRGYFWPGADWTFQGNCRAGLYTVEQA
jgi:hypothetical protein